MAHDISFVLTHSVYILVTQGAKRIVDTAVQKTVVVPGIYTPLVSGSIPRCMTLFKRICLDTLVQLMNTEVYRTVEYRGVRYRGATYHDRGI